MEDPINPLSNVKRKKRTEKSVRFGDESRLEELNIARKKKKIEKDMKDKSMVDEEDESESDSDNDQAKKKLKKKIKTGIGKRVKKLKTFHSGDIYKPPESIQKIAIKTEKDSMFEEFGGLMPDEPIECKAPEPRARDTKSVNELMQTPLPVQDFYNAVQKHKQGKQENDADSGKLERDQVISSYYIALRTCTTVYAKTSRMYDMMNNQVKKRMNYYSDTESTDQIAQKQKKPILFQRDFEQSMMKNKTPGSKERNCANENECEWFSMYGKVKVMGKECLNPSETIEFLKNGTLPEKVKPCMLCRRRDMTIHWMNARQTCGSVSSEWDFQNYYNEPEIDGEYLLSDMILSAEDEYQALDYPVVQHIRSKYKQIEVESGVYMYLQEGYKKPEDVRRERKDF
jgi:hypothetical protein